MHFKSKIEYTVTLSHDEAEAIAAVLAWAHQAINYPGDTRSVTKPLEDVQRKAMNFVRAFTAENVHPPF